MDRQALVFFTCMFIGILGVPISLWLVLEFKHNAFLCGFLGNLWAAAWLFLGKYFVVKFYPQLPKTQIDRTTKPRLMC